MAADLHRWLSEKRNKNQNPIKWKVRTGRIQAGADFAV